MQEIVGHLRDAVSAMDEAIADLEDGDLQEALGPERRALNALLKADALNRERDVTMQQPGQQGGRRRRSHGRSHDRIDGP